MSRKQQNLSLFVLTWPIFIELLLHMLMGNADTLMLSQYDDRAVAAVGVSNQIMGIVIVMFGLIAQGTTIITAQHLGASDPGRAGKTAVTAVYMNIAAGIALSLVLIFGGRTILGWMGIPAELMDTALNYLQIVGGFAFVQACIMTVGAVLKSHQFTKDVMYITLGMNVLNVIGNYILIFGAFGAPSMGAAGVAVSTAAARGIGLIVLFWLLVRKVKTPLPWLYPLTRLPAAEFQALMRIGIPTAGEQVSYQASQLVLTYFTAGLGTAALTTRVYTLNIIMFSLLFSLAIAQGTQILVGRLAGERRYDAAYRRCLRSLRAAMGISTFAAAMFYLFGDAILSIFTSNEDIIRSGTMLLLLTILLEPGRAFNLVIINSLRAAGDVRYPVYIGILSMWGIAVTVSWTAGIWLGLGLAGIWIGMVLDEWIRGLLMLRRWRSRKWEHMGFVEPATGEESAEDAAPSDRHA
ncbi:MATE family efflux transporter [Alkalicoccus chagannorensis]|uniref:MATE family efflux transporter n=1 Tax=Alkalicoccus chagannorensis TaxID=427072 RepID=UPI000479A131|nr:MATE family efflux transporter [Alkalicoccus chagannorensis]